MQDDNTKEKFLLQPKKLPAIHSLLIIHSLLCLGLNSTSLDFIYRILKDIGHSKLPNNPLVHVSSVLCTNVFSLILKLLTYLCLQKNNLY